MSVQSTNTVNISPTMTTTTSSSTITSDFDIFPVDCTINPSNYMYDGITVLNINSSLSPNSNLIKGQYFNPVTGSPLGSVSDWNFDLCNTSFLNGTFATSSLLNETTTIYNNLLPYGNTTGLYNIDITNGGIATTQSNSAATMFFSLTSQPYATYQGVFINGTPTATNVIPGYSGNNSDNFIFTSDYYIQQKNEIIQVQLVFTVSNTDSLNVNNTTSLIYNSAPTISVIVTNKIISKEVLGGITSNNQAKSKIYTSGPIPLRYNSSGVAFNPAQACSTTVNNVPLIIAPGYISTYVTMPIAYIPPIIQTQAGVVLNYIGQYLNAAVPNTTTPTYADCGYVIENNFPYFPSAGLTSLNTTSLPTAPTLFGHFVVGIAYSSDFSYYNPGGFIYSEVLIKNIWRSPISIYNSYSGYSITDMATKLVVVLFGKSINGGTFLVLNSGTPINLINSYGVTSLSNFMSIMRAVISFYNESTPIIDYFINGNVISQVNTLGTYSIQVLTVQPIIDGAIANPSTFVCASNAYYMLLNSKNSTNLSIDPANQNVFGDEINVNYFGINNGIISSVGNCLYYNSELSMFSTVSGQLFGNCLYLGQNSINNQTFYTLLILPEALFVGTPNSNNINQIYIYNVPFSIFFISSNANISTEFTPQAYSYTVTSNSSNGSGTNNQQTYNVNKLIMSVCNTPIIN